MKNIIYTISLVTISSILVLACVDDDFWDTLIPETNENTTQAQNSTYVFIAAMVDPTYERVLQLTVPNGFQVQKFAEDIDEHRMKLANSTGQIYVANREAGEVLLLEDTNGDGIADRRKVVAEIPDIHDFTISGNLLYIVTINEIYRAEMSVDGTLVSPTLLTSELPDGRQHPNRTIGIGLDGMLYISVGSTCNACPEPNPLHATMLRANADGSDIQIFAEGPRNTIGFGWHPQTEELWGMDHNIDMLGDNEPYEELNKIIDGEFYGYGILRR